jgi:hypothetical protein
MRHKAAQSVYIIYGFAEGQWLGRRLRRELTAAGYAMAESADKADVIIAHSGGCYLAPAASADQIVFHIGYTYWPGKPLRTSFRELVAYESSHYDLAYWVKRSLVNCFYALNVMHTWRMVPGWRDPIRHLKKLNPDQHIFINARFEQYCDPYAVFEVTGGKQRYLSLYESHNDIWKSPAQFVDLLQSVV